MSVPVPPSNALPPTDPAKSITTWSPIAALCLAGASDHFLLCAASWSICSRDLLFGDFGGQPLELEVADIGLGDRGQRFDHDRDFGVVARLIVAVELDLGTDRGADGLFEQQFLDARPGPSC